MTVSNDEKRRALAVYYRVHGHFPKAPNKRSHEGAEYRAFQKRYFDDPAGFARDCIRWPKGGGPTGYQVETFGRFESHTRVAVRGPHGLGKSATAAVMVLWFALTRDGSDWKCITTASAWRQLERYLWPEIHKWARLLDWKKIGRPRFKDGDELLKLRLDLATGAAFAVASDDPGLIEGAHADHLLYVFDEAKVIPDATWDAAEGAFSGAGDDTAHSALALAISTPGDESGRFYEIHSHAAGLEDWSTRHVTLEDAIAAGRISRQWAERMKKLWGEDSATYRNRVLGEFARQGEAGVIPLDWVEAAVERWRKLEAAGEIPTAVDVIGIDVADGGDDDSAIAKRAGDIVTGVEIVEQRGSGKTMVVAGKAKTIFDEHGCGVVVDNGGGWGAGIISRLREQGLQVRAFNPGARTKRKDRSGELRFLNVRAAAWWMMRDLLDPELGDDIALPPDKRLLNDLVAPKWESTSDGKIKIEPKVNVKKRLGRSPDAADAVIMTFWAGSTGDILGLAPGETVEEALRRREREAGVEGRGGGSDFDWGGTDDLDPTTNIDDEYW